MRLDCSQRKRARAGAEPHQELREEILKCPPSRILKSGDLQLQKRRRVRAAAVHPRPASYCLATADTSFLTSDPGIEGDAHTAVGVVGLHGNFPCATRTVAERERGRKRRWLRSEAEGEAEGEAAASTWEQPESRLA